MDSKPSCPYCAQPITTWAVMKAAMPSFVRCPRCQKRVRVTNVRVLLLLYIPVLLTIAAMMFLALRAHVAGPVPIFIAFVVLSIFAEFAVSALIVRRARFEKSE